MRSQSKGMGSADIDASMCHKIRTVPALLHCASHWQDNARGEPRPMAGATEERRLLGVGSSAWLASGDGAQSALSSEIRPDV